MKKNKTNDVKFYASYRDHDGKTHHTIQTFKNSDRTISSFRDHVFPDSKIKMM